MKVQCGQCPAKYAVADERIQDKKVRIRCRRCNAAIVVDGKVSPPLVTSTPARRSARPLSSIPAPESASPASPDQDSRPSPRPVAHTIMGGLEAPVARQLVTEHVAQSQASAQLEHAWNDAPGSTLTGTGEPQPGMPEPDRGFTEPPLRDDAERWRVALTQQDLRWMTTEEITQAFRDGAVKSETFVFRAGMPTWITLLEVSEIAQALADAQLVSAPLEPPNLEESDSRPSSPPRRLSSLPPPRRPVRNRDAAAAASPDSPRADGEVASDSDESSPFALVSERANSAKKPVDAAAADAAPDDPAQEAAASATPLVPASADVLASSAAPNAPAAPVPPSPLEPVPAPAARTSRGGGLWLWLGLALLLAAAAAFFFGPRFGLRLP
jgi:predicted Zn finger-like uncharacterized protein